MLYKFQHETRRNRLYVGKNLVKNSISRSLRNAAIFVKQLQRDFRSNCQRIECDFGFFSTAGVPATVAKRVIVIFVIWFCTAGKI